MTENAETSEEVTETSTDETSGETEGAEISTDGETKVEEGEKETTEEVVENKPETTEEEVSTEEEKVDTEAEVVEGGETEGKSFDSKILTEENMKTALKEIVALRQTGDKKKFLEAARCISQNSNLALILMSDDTQALREVLAFAAPKKPLLYRATLNNSKEFAQLAKEFNVPLAAAAEDLGGFSSLTKELNSQGVEDLIS